HRRVLAGRLAVARRIAVLAGRALAGGGVRLATTGFLGRRVFTTGGVRFRAGDVGVPARAGGVRLATGTGRVRLAAPVSAAVRFGRRDVRAAALAVRDVRFPAAVPVQGVHDLLDALPDLLELAHDRPQLLDRVDQLLDRGAD